MALYSLSDPPELRHLPWRDRERILENARQRRPRYYPAVLAFLGGTMLLAMVTNCVLMQLQLEMKDIDDRLLLGRAIYPLFVVVFGSGAGRFVFWAILYRRDMRRALRVQYLEEGIRPHVCFDCGADLTNSEGDNCPRCEAVLILHKCPACGRSTPQSPPDPRQVA